MRAGFGDLQADIKRRPSAGHDARFLNNAVDGIQRSLSSSCCSVCSIVCCIVCGMSLHRVAVCVAVCDALCVAFSRLFLHA